MATSTSFKFSRYCWSSQLKQGIKLTKWIFGDMTDSSSYQKFVHICITKTVSFAIRVCNYIYWLSRFDASINRTRPSRLFSDRELFRVSSCHRITMQVSHVIKSRKTTSTHAIQDRAALSCFGSPAPPETFVGASSVSRHVKCWWY